MKKHHRGWKLFYLNALFSRCASYIDISMPIDGDHSIIFFFSSSLKKLQKRGTESEIEKISKARIAVFNKLWLKNGKNSWIHNPCHVDESKQHLNYGFHGRKASSLGSAPSARAGWEWKRGGRAGHIDSEFKQARRENDFHQAYRLHHVVEQITGARDRAEGRGQVSWRLGRLALFIVIRAYLRQDGRRWRHRVSGRWRRSRQRGRNWRRRVRRRGLSVFGLVDRGVRDGRHRFL